jgi:hypothetical protein
MSTKVDNSTKVDSSAEAFCCCLEDLNDLKHIKNILLRQVFGPGMISATLVLGKVPSAGMDLSPARRKMAKPKRFDHPL